MIRHNEINLPDSRRINLQTMSRLQTGNPEVNQ